MNVLVIEACRSPEFRKRTEVAVLAEMFRCRGISFDVCTNDYGWPSPVALDEALIRDRLRKADVDTVHLAVHGVGAGLVLRWSAEPDFRRRVPLLSLSGEAIASMSGWNGRLVVSGACESSALAEHFLKAGARAVIAPERPVPWARLGDFFCLFYEAIWAGEPIRAAVQDACRQFPELGSYRAIEGTP